MQFFSENEEEEGFEKRPFTTRELISCTRTGQNRFLDLRQN